MVLLTSKHGFAHEQKLLDHEQTSFEQHHTSKHSFAHRQIPLDHEQTRFEQPSFDHEQTLMWNSKKHQLNWRKHPVTLSPGDCARTGVACGTFVTTEVLGLYISSRPCIQQTPSTTTNTQLRTATERACMHRLRFTRYVRRRAYL